MPEQQSIKEQKTLSPFKDFIDRFHHAAGLGQKRQILKRLLEENPRLKLGKLVDELETLSDQKACLEIGAALKGTPGFFQNISFSRKLAAIEGLAKKQAGNALKEILKPDRKGKKFPEILFGKLAPFVARDESLVCEYILSLLSGLRPQHSVKKLYGQFIRDLSRAFIINRQVKEKGINEASLGAVFEENGEALAHRGLRMAVESLFFYDPCYQEYHETVDRLLDALLQNESTGSGTAAESGRFAKELADLRGIRDLDAFLNKAEAITETGGAYALEAARIFELYCNDPLINIYKLIKFPLNAERFHQWLGDAPLPGSLSDELERKIASLPAAAEKKLSALKPDGGYEACVRLFYAFDISFTDKYKLIYEAGVKQANQAPFQFAQKQIKEVQFKLENKFLNSMLEKISQALSFSEIDELFIAFRKKIDQKTADFNSDLKKNIESLIKAKKDDRYQLLFSLLKYIAERKMLNTESFLALDRKVNPEKELNFAVLLACTLIDCYFLFNARLIIDFFADYYSIIKKTDGMVLKRRMSLYTKEELYAFMKQYAKERLTVRSELEKYLGACAFERSLRQKASERLGGAPELSGPQFILKGIRYGKTVTLVLIDQNGKKRFERSITGINTFLDFAHSVKRFRLDSYITGGQRGLKVLFQTMHLDALGVIEDYLKDRINLLSLDDSLLVLTSDEIKENVSQTEIPAVYLQRLAAGGEKEIASREDLITKLEAEHRDCADRPEVVSRAAAEIGGQKTAIEHIRFMLDFIAGLDGKNHDAQLLSRKDVDDYLATHRIADNIRSIHQAKARLDSEAPDQPGREKNQEQLLGYLSSFPAADMFETDEASIEGNYASLEDAVNAVNQYFLLHTAEENEVFISSGLEAVKKETAARSSYIERHEQCGGSEALLYRYELFRQRDLLGDLESFRAFLASELAQYRKIVRLNEEAGQEYSRISAETKETDPQKRGDVLSNLVLFIKDDDLKCETAARFFLTEEERSLKNTMEQILAESGVDRYKILLSLFRVLDAQPDGDVKIKILDEFEAYLRAEKPDVLKVLKPLLDIQRVKIEAETKQHTVRISDFWRLAETATTQAEKLSLIDRLLADPEWEIYRGYLANIRKGLIEENVDEFLASNKTLPLALQRELLEKMKLYRADRYRIPEINTKLSRKEWELDARLKLLRNPGERVFSSSALKLITRPETGSKRIALELDRSQAEAEKTAVKKEFSARRVPAAEIEEYLTREFTPALRNYDKEPERKIAQEQKQERDPVLTSDQAPRRADGAVRRAPSLPDALQFFGLAKETEETAIVAEVEKLISEKRIPETEALIKKSVIREKTEKNDIPGLVRIINSISAREGAVRQPHVKSFLQAQIESLAKNIVAEASRAGAGGDLPEPEQNQSDEDKNESGETTEKNGALPQKKPAGIPGLIYELESIGSPTPLAVFAQECGFAQGEIERLEKLIPELAEKNAFLYIPAAKLILGRGKLKGLVAKVFNERLSRKKPSVEERLLKAVWDEIQRSVPKNRQCEIVGAASETDLAEIGREIEQLLRPDGIPGKSERVKKQVLLKKSTLAETKSPKNASHHIEKDRPKPRPPKSPPRSSSVPMAGQKAEKAPAGNEKKYNETLFAYVEKSYAPVITGYIRRLYKKKADFNFSLQGRRDYCTYDMLKDVIHGILRKDASGRSHYDLFDSLQQDPNLFPVLVDRLFSVVTAKNGKKYYFPKFLKGDVKL